MIGNRLNKISLEGGVAAPLMEVGNFGGASRDDGRIVAGDAFGKGLLIDKIKAVSTTMLTSTTSTADTRALPTRLGREELIRAFRTMYLSRRIDDREILLKRQNKIYFQISGAGHEAISAAAGYALRPGHDWFYLYYRDRACALALGVTAEEMLLGAVGAAADPASGGRQMPSHWGSKRLNIVSTSSPTGTQFLQAIGCADANRRIDPESDAVTLVCTGDGATSEGEFWESLNIACLEKLAVVYVVEDNGYAISVPVECQTAGGDVSKLVSGFPHLKVYRCDGTDFVASYEAMAEAVEHCRRNRTPVMVHATCIRPYSHSLSDDEKLYKTKAERPRGSGSRSHRPLSGMADFRGHSRPARDRVDYA